MKTKQVPVMITLVAGLITCLIGFVMQMETARFVKALVIVLISFYILGCIAKVLLDKNFKEETEEATDEAVEEADSEEQEESAEDSTEEE
ncbi:MAG: hypothetical protein HFI74_07165 [Lachnospiraceae bacterium]|jgi:phosphotransferase system  glucose/maltose/N-acetylglucosamine-specific IIC component|nr:hypothetical protein [Lachnospiraceae bacterium]